MNDVEYAAISSPEQKWNYMDLNIFHIYDDTKKNITTDEKFNIVTY